jgi:hypothetical protein
LAVFIKNKCYEHIVSKTSSSLSKICMF